MADAVATQVLYENASDYVVKLTNVSDGTGESAVTKVDVSALTPGATEVSIAKIWYATSGMSVRLLWDATTDVVALTLPDTESYCLDFSEIPPGQLVNNAGSGVTGDIQLTTFGHTLGDTYTIILWCKKRVLA